MPHLGDEDLASELARQQAVVSRGGKPKSKRLQRLIRSVEREARAEEIDAANRAARESRGFLQTEVSREPSERAVSIKDAIDRALGGIGRAATGAGQAVAGAGQELAEGAAGALEAGGAGVAELARGAGRGLRGAAEFTGFPTTGAQFGENLRGALGGLGDVFAGAGVPEGTALEQGIGFGLRGLAVSRAQELATRQRAEERGDVEAKARLDEAKLLAGFEVVPEGTEGSFKMTLPISGDTVFVKRKLSAIDKIVFKDDLRQEAEERREERVKTSRDRTEAFAEKRTRSAIIRAEKRQDFGLLKSQADDVRRQLLESTDNFTVNSDEDDVVALATELTRLEAAMRKARPNLPMVNTTTRFEEETRIGVDAALERSRLRRTPQQER